ncbi:integral membrane protein [Verticillium dahliae]|nr:integral membrane protein [Verticillium dahliae]
MGWVRNASPEVEAISQWPLIIGLCVALSFMSITVVSSRLFIRHKARGLAADDYFAGLSMLFALVYSILTVAQTRYGLGLPVLLRPKANLITYTRVNYAGRPFYQLGISFFKIALLISYLRLLQAQTTRHIVDKSWNPLKAGVCLPPGPSFTGYAVVTIVSDIIVTLLPIPVLLKLNIKLEKKLGLIVVFILGIFTTICSVMRYTQIDRIQFGDGNSTMLVLWGTIEFNVGNVVSSLPFLAPVFVKKARSYRSKPTSGYGRSGSHVLGGKSGDRYKLSDVGRDKSAFVSANDRSNSEENILSTLPDHSIVKSMTYSVQVDDNAAATSSSSKAAGRLDL